MTKAVYVLFQYSLLLLAVGMITDALLHYKERGWPKAQHWWGYPLIFTCYGLLVLIAVASFILIARALAEK